MAYITLNKNNFFNNLDIIAKATKSVDKIAVVLKDNAYGHGLKEVSLMAKEYGVKKAVVFDDKEASVVEEFFDYVLVLGNVKAKKSDKIRYTINDIDNIKNFQKGTLVELNVDTGMHRNGVMMDELEEAFSRIKQAGLILEGIFTHHRSADELSSEWYWQKENFKKVKQTSKELAKKFGFSPLRFHSCNSAALFRTTNFDEDMARVGIVIYGCLKMPDALKVDGIKPVLSLYATKNSSRELKKGDRVGYGATYEMPCDGVVSNYNFGYGDGFFRHSSNAYVTPNGEKVLGRISMDSCSFMSDKDEILIFDDARVASKYYNSFSYEVLTSLKETLERKII